MTMGEHTYAPGEMMRPADRETLTDRQIATLWQLGQIDTLPRDAEPDEAELERLTAPAVTAVKSQSAQKQASGARR